MTSTELLKAKKPEDVFPGNLDEAKELYRSLARKLHPDVNKEKDATLIFQRLTELYELAVKQIEAGTFGGRSVLSVDGRSVTYLRSRPFELGRVYIGDDHVTYIVDKEYKTLFENGLANTGIFSYKSDKMREEISKYLPRTPKSFRTSDNGYGLTVPKDPGLLSLRDVIEHFDGKLDPRHAAWVGSSLHNLACYLSWAGIGHADISPDTFFISPEKHYGALLGGWWYAAKLGKKITYVPKRTMNWIPWEVKTKKTSNHLTDLELIRATVRESLGDIAGRDLGKAPKEMAVWLRAVASGSAVDTYKSWMKMLEDAFGKRKFTVLELDSSTLYNTK